jgi:GH15 family glucan-1,4-alpha-glucosidase
VAVRLELHVAGRIEDYALIGDMQTAALVCRDGTVDWLCLPRFDSHAVFAGLLGTEEHGFWRLGPAHAADAAPPTAARRRYRGDSLILESEWDTPRGTVRVTDFMPPRDGAPQLIRIVEGVTGRVPMRSALRMRFSYGRVVPWVHKHEGRTVAVAGPDSVWFDTEPRPTARPSRRTRTSRSRRVTGSRSPSPGSPRTSSRPRCPSRRQSLEATEDFWRDWVDQCTYHGPYREAVVRSLITLKALTYAPTGGIVAAPTTSLPGGDRRRPQLGLPLHLAARRGDHPVLAAAHRLPRGGARLARVAAARGRRRPGEPADHVRHRGRAGAGRGGAGLAARVRELGPVRVGNGAAHQLQLDVYGEVTEALHLAHMTGLARNDYASLLQLKLIRYLEEHWDEPDEGIWEVRGPRRHFVHSKVMAWVAVDRTIKLIESGDADGPLEKWRELRDDIHRDVCEKGYDKERNTFTQSYGSKELDASLLLIPQMGFLPPDDKRVIGTIEAIQRELSTSDGFILRYPTSGEDEGVDGLEGDEGAFLACSFWMADDLAMIGRVDEARKLFEKLLALRNDLGSSPRSGTRACSARSATSRRRSATCR